MVSNTTPGLKFGGFMIIIYTSFLFQKKNDIIPKINNFLEHLSF